MNRKFDLIIFDWDGTLVDSIDWIVESLQYAARKCHARIPSAQEVRNIIGLSIECAVDTLFPGMDNAAREQLIKAYGQRFFSKKIQRDDLFSGVYEMLVALHASGYLLAVATGKKNAGLVKAMQGTGVVEFFSSTRSADQTASKPDPRMINEIVHELAVCKHRTVMVGDSVHDLQMAHNAGVAAIAVECGAHDRAVLNQFKPQHCLTQTCAILGVMGGYDSGRGYVEA